MRTIDFLSIAPQTFIFQKSSNKTTFGGFLTLIYGLIILIMAIVYYIDYHINDKYIISYTQYIKGIDEEKENDPRYNPTLKFIFDILDFSSNSLSDNFILYNFKTNEFIERNKLIELNVSYACIFILYNCTDLKCDIREEDLKGSTDFEPIFHFNFYHSYYDFNLQNDEEPIKLNKNSNLMKFWFNPKIEQGYDYFWQVAKVTDEQGILDKITGNKKESFGGSFAHLSFSTMKDTFNNTYPSIINGKYYTGIFKLLFIFNCVNQFEDHIEYKRKKVSIFDLIANVCSLALTIYNGFKLCFSFLYSSNFDNYKIIDRILSTRDISIKKITKKNEDTKSPLLTELKEFDEENEYENENEKEDKQVEDKKVEKNKGAILPKYHFFDFICNLFSCCCKNNNAQKCISACNEIREKYYSI